MGGGRKKKASKKKMKNNDDDDSNSNNLLHHTSNTSSTHSHGSAEYPNSLGSDSAEEEATVDRKEVDVAETLENCSGSAYLSAVGVAMEDPPTIEDDREVAVVEESVIAERGEFKEESIVDELAVDSEELSQIKAPFGIFPATNRRFDEYAQIRRIQRRSGERRERTTLLEDDALGGRSGARIQLIQRRTGERERGRRSWRTKWGRKRDEVGEREKRNSLTRSWRTGISLTQKSIPAIPGNRGHSDSKGKPNIRYRVSPFPTRYLNPIPGYQTGPKDASVEAMEPEQVEDLLVEAVSSINTKSRGVVETDDEVAIPTSTSHVVDNGKELETHNKPSEDQPLIGLGSNPLPVQRTSWVGCCGPFEVFSGGNR